MTTAAAPALPQGRRSRRLTRALYVTAVFLALVGIFAAVMRSAIVGLTLATPVTERPELSAYDALAVDLVVGISHLAPGSAEYVRTRNAVVRLGAKYADHPVYTFAHMVPGILILLLAPVQFNAGIRRRHLRLHRWTGRAMLALVLLSSISAVYFGVVSEVPPFERPTILLFSALFLFAAVRAFVAIRARDITRHREWMIRMVAMAIGIGTVRIVSLGLLLLFRLHWETTMVLSMWVGWLLSVSIAELWIRHTRGVPVSALAASA